jgi:hypothetical protein
VTPIATFESLRNGLMLEGRRCLFFDEEYSEIVERAIKDPQTQDKKGNCTFIML